MKLVGRGSVFISGESGLNDIRAVREEESMIRYFRFLVRSVRDFSKRSRVFVVNYLYWGGRAPRGYCVISVCPMKITKRSAAAFSRKDVNVVAGGGWDKEFTLLSDEPKVNMVNKRIKEGLSWEDTGIFEYMLRKSRSPDPYNVSERYKILDDFIDHVKKGGRFTLTKEQMKNADDILVCIGRDGEVLLQYGGTHRLAIAQAMKLDKVPVRVGVVHEDFVKSGGFYNLRKNSK